MNLVANMTKTTFNNLVGSMGLHNSKPACFDGNSPSQWKLSEFEQRYYLVRQMPLYTLNNTHMYGKFALCQNCDSYYSGWNFPDNRFQHCLICGTTMSTHKHSYIDSYLNQTSIVVRTYFSYDKVTKQYQITSRELRSLFPKTYRLLPVDVKKLNYRLSQSQISELVEKGNNDIKALIDQMIKVDQSYEFNRQLLRKYGIRYE